MKIERISDNRLVLGMHIGEATKPDGEKIDISLGIPPSILIVRIGNRRYSISIESIIKDVIEFDKEGGLATEG